MNPGPTPARIRAAAARLVSQTADSGRSLDELLAGDQDEGSARGLKRSLAYGTLRWHFRLIAILGRLTERPVAGLQPELRALLEVGLFQLLSGETAEHAAVAETVNATRELGFARASGFVNAVLRRFQRERDSLLRVVDADTAARTAHPGWFVDALLRDRPAEAGVILDANNAHPPMWLRVNRMRSSLADYQREVAAAGWQADRHPFAPDALRIEPAVDARALPGFAAGHVSVQDAAAQLAIELLAPQPGERILDACAAPGGKTCHILERAAGRCAVTALDISAPRLARVRENLARLGLVADVRAGDLVVPAGWWDGVPYDRILLDVPCSATGVIRRHPDIKLLRRGSDIQPLAERQRAMLRAAWACLRPGGTLVYTSCSVLRAENEEIVADFLAGRPDSEDRSAAMVRGWGEGRGDSGGPGYFNPTGEAGMDGFYYACLSRQP